MKKIKVFFIALIFPFIAFSQGAEIVPFAGYMFGGSINFYEGKYKISDGLDYGLSVLVPIKEVVDLELNYTRLDSEGKFTAYSNGGYSDTAASISSNYFQIGAVKAFTKQNPKIVPFGSFSLGATWFEVPEYQDTWMFSIVAGLGVKFMFSTNVGIMIRGRLMMPLTFGNTSFYVGTGGSGFSFNSFVSPLQGDFNGGLIIKVGN